MRKYRSSRCCRSRSSKSVRRWATHQEQTLILLPGRPQPRHRTGEFDCLIVPVSIRGCCGGRTATSTHQIKQTTRKALWKRPSQVENNVWLPGTAPQKRRLRHVQQSAKTSKQANIYFGMPRPCCTTAQHSACQTKEADTKAVPPRAAQLRRYVLRVPTCLDT